MVTTKNNHPSHVTGDTSPNSALPLSLSPRRSSTPGDLETSSFHTADSDDQDHPVFNADHLLHDVSPGGNSSDKGDTFYETTDLVYSLNRTPTFSDAEMRSGATVRGHRLCSRPCRVVLLLLILLAVPGAIFRLDLRPDSGPVRRRLSLRSWRFGRPRKPQLDTVASPVEGPGEQMQGSRSSRLSRLLMAMLTLVAGIFSVSLSIEPPAGQLASSMAVGSILVGRAAGRRAGPLGAAAGGIGGGIFGCIVGFIICSVLAPGTVVLLERCLGKSPVSAKIGFLAVLMAPAFCFVAVLLSWW